MRAIRIHGFDGPEVLQLDELPIPEPGTGEVLVKVKAASLNPVDFKMRQGGYPKARPEDLPITLGRDLAGIVEKAGPGSSWKPGDEVYGQLDWKHGAYAEFAIVGEQGLAPKPRTVGMAEAGAIPLAALTAWQGLFTHGGLKSGETVLIHGGSGGVGGFAVQFAKVCGADVFATASGDGLDLVRSYGADRIIDYKHEKFEEICGDFDLILDLIGKETQERSWSVLKQGGRLISTLQDPDKTKRDEKQATALRFLVEPDAAQLGEIAELVDAGKVKVTLAKCFPLEAAAAAHRLLEEGHPNGKIVLQVE